jgi:general nucleoside transport system permease protein
MKLGLDAIKQQEVTSMTWIINFLSAAIIAAMPLLFATIGEILTEKVGNLNLGVEGMMLLGAISGFLVGNSTGSFSLAVLAGFLGGMFCSFIYGFLVITLRANQVVSGLALTTFGTGVASMLGTSVMGVRVPESILVMSQKIPIPILSKIPIIGPSLFTQDIFVYIGYITVIIVGIYLYKTTIGLNATAVGENPAAADAASININKYKYIHTLIGGGLAGLGGAYISLIYVPSWQNNIVSGRGWIAVALVIFVNWNPLLAIFGALIFGGLDIIGYRIDLPISQHLISALPYLVTILVLVGTSIRKSGKKAGPAALGLSYFKEER